MILTKYDLLTMNGKPIPAPKLKLVVIDYSQVAKDYAAGDTLQAVSDRYCISINAARDMVAAAGIEIRGPMCGISARCVAIDEAAFLARYQSGEQLQKLIKEYKIGRARARTIMTNAGVKVRTTNESVALKKLRMAA